MEKTFLFCFFLVAFERMSRMALASTRAAIFRRLGLGFHSVKGMGDTSEC